MVVLAVVAAVVAWRGGRSSSAADIGDAPRFVDDTSASSIEHSYDGVYEHFVGGGVAVFDCNGDGRDELYFAGGTSPAALYLNESPVGGASCFEQVASPVTDLTDVTGAYPLDVDSDGRLDLVVLRLGSNEVLRGLGRLPLRGRHQRTRRGRRDGLDGRVQRARGRARTRCRRLAFGNYLVPDHQRTAPTAGSRGCRSDGARPTQPPIALSPGLLHPVGAVQRLGPIGAARPPRRQRPPDTTTTGEEQLWRIAPGQPPPLYTAADGWHPLQIWGMGIASQDLTGDGYPEVFITCMGDNKLQTLENGPAQPRYADIAPSAVTAHRPHTGGDVLPVHRLAPRVRRRQQRRVDRPVHEQGQRGGDARERHARPRTTCSAANPTGASSRSAEQAGIAGYDAGVGAALVDLNRDGMLDLVVVNREANVSLLRNVGSR